MGRMKELSEEIEELRHCGEILIDVSETLRQMFSGTGGAEPEAADAVETVTAALEADGKEEAAAGGNAGQTAVSAETAEAADAQKKPKSVTLSEVRAVLAEKSRKGFTAEVRQLLQKYGAEKLSEVDAVKYADLMADAEVLGNG